jgi:4-oxalocrotonate tautomerase
MPTIQIDCSEMPKEKKIELVSKMTKLCNEVLSIPEQAFTIIIRENGRDNIGVGGTLLSMRNK